MKQDNKGFFAGLKLNKLTYISAAVVLVLAIMLAVIESVADLAAHSWFWMFAGVFCLGEGIVLYIHGLTAKASNACILCGVVLTVLGMLWFVADIIVNGALGGVGSGWWIGLIAAVIIGIICYFVPVLLNKNKK